jgi:hypothetical protein
VSAPTPGLVAPGLSPTAWTLVAVVLVVLAVVTVLCVLRARRLDRLHRRTDAARAALADALERRSAVAMRAADVLGGEGLAVRTAAFDALRACRVGLRVAGAVLEPCEGAENTLTRRLRAVDPATLPAGLAGELLDAEQLVALARRVHNDAVRDTLDLRSRRLVRGLRLAGTAPVPTYFEIADPAPRPPVAAPAVLAPPSEPGPARSDPRRTGPGHRAG